MHIIHLRHLRTTAIFNDIGFYSEDFESNYSYPIRFYSSFKSVRRCIVLSSSSFSWLKPLESHNSSKRLSNFCEKYFVETAFISNSFSSEPSKAKNFNRCCCTGLNTVASIFFCLFIQNRCLHIKLIVWKYSQFLLPQTFLLEIFPPQSNSSNREFWLLNSGTNAFISLTIGRIWTRRDNSINTWICVITSL